MKKINADTDPEFNIELGKRIRKFRKGQGMTMRELGDKLSLHEATVQKYESGKIKTINTAVIMKIANALNIEPTSLFFNEIEISNEDNKLNDESEFLEIYRKLSSKNKDALLFLAKQLKDE